MAPPRSLPELMEELVEEILLRLPPDDPACIVRVSLVCKPWHRLLSGRAFLRRYRAFHGAPPLVGFLRNRDPLDSCRFPSFIPTASIPSLAHPAAAAADWSIAWAWGTSQRLVVWYPTTGDWRELPRLAISDVMSSGAVLCAIDGCDHMDCNGGPFRVVLVASSTSGQITWACSYSSETNAWSTLASLLTTSKFCYVKLMDRGAVIGDQIYFPMYKKILKYDLGKHSLSVIIDMPDDFSNNVPILMGDGSLGLAGIRSSSLRLWSRKVNTEGVEQWVQYKSINLQSTVPGIDKPGGGAEVIGFAEGVNIILLRNGFGTFVVELKSERISYQQGLVDL
ncbi:hypothetical protein PR202_ga28502 [Eleusine coracana subsp. coracana]|uniref:F-box domain-containing protein n=1 Tax=Eleusine coracana subsp. coracana TaxID=191504 RepID=A0AAV5DIZ7_ELECO|nr:hypothetical protein PR202_ga28502 [Eleusine coracana subsp. coracana]